MPQRDGSGPLGLGARSGRGLGGCQTSGAAQISPGNGKLTPWINVAGVVIGAAAKMLGSARAGRGRGKRSRNT